MFSPTGLSVPKRCVPKTLAFPFGLRLRSKTRCFKMRVLVRRLPNGKPQERLRSRALRSKTLAFKKPKNDQFLRFTILFKIITHKITIFKLFRSLQLQFSGPTGINLRYSYSFVGLTGICLYSYSSVQLHKQMVRGTIFEICSYSYKTKWFSN